MRIYFILLFLVNIIGCGTSPLAEVHMPMEVRDFYEEYYQIIGQDKKNSGTIVIVTDLNQRVYGNCTYTSNTSDPWTIKINAHYWVIHNDQPIWQKVLIFHELTHCTFHSPAHSSDPQSYMYTTPDLIDFQILNLTQQVLDYTRQL